MGIIPQDPQRIIRFLESLRKPLIRAVGLVLLASCAGYVIADTVLSSLQTITQVHLALYGIPETFLALLSLSLAFGVFVSVPYISYILLAGLQPLFLSLSTRALLAFWVASIVLFYAGAFFCLNISLPYGAKFLLSFENEHVQAIISVRKFVSFCSLFVFGFGIIFEMPLGMMLLSRLGLVRAKTLASYRRYALLGAAIVSAILTPTPDVFNMMLMAVPLYILFEIGLIAMRLGAKR
jgi:sec-independent protein translocase protein TatC